MLPIGIIYPLNSDTTNCIVFSQVLPIARTLQSSHQPLPYYDPHVLQPKGPGLTGCIFVGLFRNPAWGASPSGWWLAVFYPPTSLQLHGLTGLMLPATAPGKCPRACIRLGTDSLLLCLRVRVRVRQARSTARHYPTH